MIIEQDHARDRPTTRVAHGEEAVDPSSAFSVQIESEPAPASCKRSRWSGFDVRYPVRAPSSQANAKSKKLR